MTATSIETVLSEILGPGIGLGIETVSGDDGLRPVEAIAVSKAVPKRVAEFAAGRRAARKALGAIGHDASDLPAGPDRAPVWPKGMTGTITHDGDLALAAAARLEDVRSLGLDLTEAAPLPGGTRERILRHVAEEGLTDLEARVVFSAKESLYKALSPHVGFVFGFSAAAVRPDIERGSFEAWLLQPLGPFQAGQVWHGRLAIEGGRLVTGLVLRTVDI
jgi:4'-phosphopantetheinyl transferase EntD